MLQCRDVSHRANGYNRIHQNGCLLLATFESDGKNVLHPLLDCHLSLILFQDLVMDYKKFLVHMSRDTNVIFFIHISSYCTTTEGPRNTQLLVREKSVVM